jgi:hypothetical protein
MQSRQSLRILLTISVLLGISIMPAPLLAREVVQDWELVNPAGAFKIIPIEIASRLASLEGKTVGLKWNDKPNGNIVLDRIAELLTKQVRGVKIIKFYEVEPTTAPQSANIDDSRRKAQIIAKYKPDIVIGSQCD